MDWQPLLANDSFKDIIVDSLRFLGKENKITIYDFVIMETHFHLIWQIRGDHKRGDVQRDFLKYTGQQILRRLRKEHSLLAETLHVASKDRKYQVWQRNSLVISLESHGVFIQKLNYIHNNPVKAGLCGLPEEYRYSSARFYEMNERDWDFVTHYEG